MVDISLIIPAYNEEKNIIRCLQQICVIPDDTLEIIVVDDGSTDKTALLCHEFAEKDLRVKYFYKENGGVSSARNMGLEKSTGKWILFVDADDCLVIDCWDELKQLLSNAKEDIIQCNLYKNTGVLPFTESCISSEKMQLVCLNRMHYVKVDGALYKNVYCSAHGSVAKLFNREYIHQHMIKFNDAVGLGEDILFYLEALQHTDRVRIFNKQLYRIYENVNSATRRYNPKMIHAAEMFSNQLMNFIKKYNKGTEFVEMAQYQVFVHIEVGIVSALISMENKNSLLYRARMLKQLLKENPIFQSAIEGTFKHRQNICNSKNEKIRMILLRKKLYMTYLVLKRIASNRYHKKKARAMQ